MYCDKKEKLQIRMKIVGIPTIVGRNHFCLPRVVDEFSYELQDI